MSRGSQDLNLIGFDAIFAAKLETMRSVLQIEVTDFGMCFFACCELVHVLPGTHGYSHDSRCTLQMSWHESWCKCFAGTASVGLMIPICGDFSWHLLQQTGNYGTHQFFFVTLVFWKCFRHFLHGLDTPWKELLQWCCINTKNIAQIRWLFGNDRKIMILNRIVLPRRPAIWISHRLAGAKHAPKHNHLKLVKQTCAYQ
jgi:hypothetical protein